MARGCGRLPTAESRILGGRRAGHGPALCSASRLHAIRQQSFLPPVGPGTTSNCFAAARQQIPFRPSISSCLRKGRRRKFGPRTIILRANSPSWRPKFGPAIKCGVAWRPRLAAAGTGSAGPELSQARRPRSDFLPADIGTWQGGKEHKVAHAIPDYELRKWTKAITANGSSLWLIVDSCCSGATLRGGETARKVDPAALGISDEISKRPPTEPSCAAAHAAEPLWNRFMN